jgi:hypothetical protein
MFSLLAENILPLSFNTFWTTAIKKPLRLAAAFANYLFSLCNKERCGRFPHHTHHHIANKLTHFSFLSETNISTEKFNMQIIF